MLFDWKTFLDNNRITYVEHGPNVAQGNVNIHCPFCGASDKSEHLGVNLTNNYWGCWRDTSHRGKAPQRLIVALIGCSYTEANNIVGHRVQPLTDGFNFISDDPDSIFDDVDEDTTSTTILEMPKSFRKIKSTGVTKRYFDYIQSRGFSKGSTRKLIEQYSLRCCLYDKWAGRIIVPVFNNGKLFTWTGRSIKNSTLRYMSLSNKPEKAEESGDPLALGSIKEVLFNETELKCGGKKLFIVEGPFDVLKLDFYAQRYDCRATCLFGMTVSKLQLYSIIELADYYDEVIILLDTKEQDVIMELSAELSVIGAQIGCMPVNVEDPGELSLVEVKRLCKLS